MVNSQTVVSLDPCMKIFIVVKVPRGDKERQEIARRLADFTRQAGHEPFVAFDSPIDFDLPTVGYSALPRIRFSPPAYVLTALCARHRNAPSARTGRVAATSREM